MPRFLTLWLLRLHRAVRMCDLRNAAKCFDECVRQAAELDDDEIEHWRTRADELTWKVERLDRQIAALTHS